MIPTETIIAGILTATVVFYIRSCINHAAETRTAARRLHGYLTRWKMWVIEKNAFSILSIGVDLDREFEQTFTSTGNAETVVEIEENKKEEVRKKVYAGIESTGDSDFDEIKKRLERIPAATFDALDSSTERSTQNLVDGKTFITDREAALIGQDAVLRCIEMKGTLCEMMQTGELLIHAYRSCDTAFSLESYRDQIFDLIWKTVKLGEHISYLEKRCQTIESQSLIQLASHRFLTGQKS